MGGSFPPTARHLNRPAIIKWITMNRSSSISSTIRFPIRRTPRTLVPAISDTGGSNVRSTNGFAITSFSSGSPTIRRSSCSRYTVMSGSSGIAHSPV